MKNDCPDAEIRDRLPDLLHDRLTVTARAAVIAHIDGCVDCREELELLRGVKNVLVTPAPRIDISYVVSALPKPPSRRVQPAAPRRSTWVDWRIAAAVTLLVVGGSSVAVVTRGTAPEVSRTTPLSATAPAQPVAGDTLQPVIASTPAVARPSTASQETLTVASAEQGASAGLGMAGRLADLNDQQLQSLLDEIDQMKAVPITDPEPVTIKVEGKPAPPDEET